jgi:uncharacterized membrane protein (DUF373 family)
MDSRDVTTGLNRSVTWLQTVVAGLLVVLFLMGVVNFGILVGNSILDGGLLNMSNVVGLIVSSIDIVLYLFIVVELFKTIIAYVEAQSVVLAVIHAGMIAVVRQIITFKPGDAKGPTEAFMEAGVYALLLLVLLIGFFIVHRQIDDDERQESGQ